MTDHPKEYLRFLSLFHTTFAKMSEVYNQMLEEDPEPEYIPLLDMSPEHRSLLLDAVLGPLSEKLDDKDDMKVGEILAEAFTWGVIAGHSVNMAYDIMGGEKKDEPIRPMRRQHRRRNR